MSVSAAALSYSIQIARIERAKKFFTSCTAKSTWKQYTSHSSNIPHRISLPILHALRMSQHHQTLPK